MPTAHSSNAARGDQSPRNVVATGIASRAGRGRALIHVAVAILAWIGFGALWVWQIEVYVPGNWLAGLQLTAILFAAYWFLVPAWVRWNRSIHQRSRLQPGEPLWRRHRRTTPLRCEVDFTRDKLDRPVVAVPEVGLNPPTIIISMDPQDSVKRYSVPPAPAEPTRVEPTPAELTREATLTDEGAVA